MKVTLYKNYSIWASAFPDFHRQWIGQAALRPLSGHMVTGHSPLVFDQEAFASKEEAEEFASFAAELFIDEYSNAAPQ